MSRVVAVAPAFPGHVHPQADITETLGPLLTADPERRRLLERLHVSSGVGSRHLALPLDGYAGLTSFGAANEHFVRTGTDLAARAARQALDACGIDPAEVDFLLLTSVTGVAAPSLDALLVPRLGLRPDVRRMPSFGLGCSGGAAGIARVHDYLTGHPNDVGLLVSVELCSLTLQHEDRSTANLVASGLFGDGAAAVVMVGDEHPARSPDAPTVTGTRSVLHPGTQGDLGWRVTDSGFQIVLAAGLPAVIEEHLGQEVTGLLEVHDLKVRDVETWVVHAGGPRILEAVSDALDLDHDALVLSRRSLATVGNLSSASVLHVLALTLAQGGHVPGSTGVLMAFGPGVSTDLVLLRWPTTDRAGAVDVGA